MRVLITGAKGFIGSVLAQGLARRGHCVFACVGSSCNDGEWRSDTPNFQYVHGNLLTNAALPDKVDAVVHAAARSPWPGVSNTSLLNDNVLLTDRMITYAKRVGVTRFIYLSSLSVYGDISTNTVDESTPIINLGIYGATKRLGEQLLQSEHQWLPSISIRLPGVIGPKSVRNWMTQVLLSARDGREIEGYNAKASFNNAAHVEDIVNFVSHLLGVNWSGAEIVNIAARGEISIEDAVQIIVSGFGDRSRVVFREEARPSFTISSARAIELFGYKPMVIDEMLKKFVQDNI